MVELTVSSNHDKMAMHPNRSAGQGTLYEIEIQVQSCGAKKHYNPYRADWYRAMAQGTTMDETMDNTPLQKDAYHQKENPAIES